MKVQNQRQSQIRRRVMPSVALEAASRVEVLIWASTVGSLSCVKLQGASRQISIII